MATLRDIGRRIVGVKNTAKITQAMRMVSASKLKRAQRAIESARPYVLKLSEILTNLVTSLGESYDNPLVQQRKNVNKVVAIVIASDKGLCGSFNNNIFKFTTSFLKNDLRELHPDADISLVPMGKRTCQHFTKTDFDILKQYPDVFSNLKFETAKEVVDIVKSSFINEETDKVYIFFNEFKSILQQIPSHTTLLPIEQVESEEEVGLNSNVDYIFEPEQKAILDDLLPKHLDIQLWRSLLESNAAEQASRMIAMENATTNANDLVQHLELVYNKKRQAAITTEMLEIVSGAEALKSA